MRSTSWQENNDRFRPVADNRRVRLRVAALREFGLATLRRLSLTVALR